ncbi:MAG: hypothetical protein CMI09_13020 [Oceanospirillaceae bacterium]|nr:hypothetical protein [Oceanospirillaceae bacterium]
MEQTTFDATLLLLTAVLFYTLLIERLMEVLKACYDYAEFALGGREYWNRSAQRLVQRLDEQRSNGRIQYEISKAIKDYLSRDHPGLEGVEALSAEQLRTLTLRVVIKVCAILLGVIVAFGMGINVFDLLRDMNTQVLAEAGKEAAKVNVYFSSDRVPDWLGTLLSGIAMGLGSDPLHRVISRLEKARKQSKEA